MHLPRSAVVLALVLLGPALTVFLLERPDARGAEDARAYDFILQETQRVDPGGRNRRESLGLYRYRDYQYADPRYTQLENYLFDVKEPLGIHSLLERGFHIVDVEPADPSPLFVVRIDATTFQALVGRR